MKNKSAIVAETSRLILRHFQENDLDRLAPILADPEVMYFSAKGVKTREETQEFIKWMLSSYATEGYGLYAVVYKENLQLIGYCGLILWLIEGRREVEVGYRLSPVYWGKGLATEAATATRDYAFEKLGIIRLITIIQPENLRSIRVADKIGMKYEKDTVFFDLNCRIYSQIKQNN